MSKFMLHEKEVKLFVQAMCEFGTKGLEIKASQFSTLLPVSEEEKNVKIRDLISAAENIIYDGRCDVRNHQCQRVENVMEALSSFLPKEP